MATSGYFDMATTGYFQLAIDIPGRLRAHPLSSSVSLGGSRYATPRQKMIVLLAGHLPNFVDHLLRDVAQK
jgi:hypothetical protein